MTASWALEAPCDQGPEGEKSDHPGRIVHSRGPWEIRLVAQEGDQEAYVWSSDDPLGCSLVPNSPLIITTVNRRVKHLQPAKDVITRG